MRNQTGLKPFDLQSYNVKSRILSPRCPQIRTNTQLNIRRLIIEAGNLTFTNFSDKTQSS